MLDWSDVDLAVRDAVREFVDKEIRPHVDALESGEMEPYPIIRKLFATFGIADMARDSLDKRLARLREGGEPSGRPSGGMLGGGGGWRAWASSWSASCAGCAWGWSPGWASASG